MDIMRNRGGAKIGFYVRPQYHLDISSTLHLTFISRPKESKTIHEHRVISLLEEVIDEWDELWLCISSDALKKGDWLKGLLERMPSVKILSLTPGMKDKSWLKEKFPHREWCFGLISFVAWQHPIHKADQVEACRTTIHYWKPPLSSLLFEGLSDHSHRILRMGGMKTKEKKELSFSTAMGSSLLLTSMACLELKEWSLLHLRSRESRVFLSACIAEAQRVVMSYFGSSAFFFPILSHPIFLYWILFWAPKCTPFPLEEYLQYHFTKVSPQTREILKTWVEHADELDIAVPNLHNLERQLTT